MPLSKKFFYYNPMIQFPVLSIRPTVQSSNQHGVSCSISQFLTNVWTEVNHFDCSVQSRRASPAASPASQPSSAASPASQPSSPAAQSSPGPRNVGGACDSTGARGPFERPLVNPLLHPNLQNGLTYCRSFCKHWLPAIIWDYPHFGKTFLKKTFFIFFI